ncbi:hypothetical protein [Spirillospora sp. CA-128828]|uniref:hypothetical protein n=1 Tax=Spirillospora sp. CA-128828 TaxID=3240033 RepID=UPI003D8CDB5C
MASNQGDPEPRARVLQTSQVPLLQDGTRYIHGGNREEVEARAAASSPGATVRTYETREEFLATGEGDEPLTFPAVKITRK